jgi:hypothetical protein
MLRYTQHTNHHSSERVLCASKHDLCYCVQPDILQEDPVFVCTAYVFFWSKFWEWGDSALLLAKGKDLSW